MEQELDGERGGSEAKESRLKKRDERSMPHPNFLASFFCFPNNSLRTTRIDTTFPLSARKFRFLTKEKSRVFTCQHFTSIDLSSPAKKETKFYNGKNILLI